MKTLFGSPDFIPIKGDKEWKVVLKPRAQYDSVRTNTINKAAGIKYTYGLAEGQTGMGAEVIEVHFDRGNERWRIASSVKDWMNTNRTRLPGA